MKKWIVLALSFSLVLNFTACKKKTQDVYEETNITQVTQEPVTQETTQEVVEPISYEKEIKGGKKVIAPGENGLLNSDFKGQLEGWELLHAEGVVQVAYPEAGGLSLVWDKVDDEQGVILKQTPITLEQSKKYRVTFDAVAKQATQVQILVKNATDPALIYGEQTLELTDTLSQKTFDFIMEQPFDEGAVFEIHWKNNLVGQEVIISQLSLVRVIGELVWGDEFEYEGLPDKEKWIGGVGGTGWGNGELQYYTGAVENNVWVDKGILTITAKKEVKDTKNYTSARLTTYGKAKWSTGRIEINAKLPEGVGTWPAIWMLSTGNKYGDWPRSGEIDIMEHVGFDMDNVHGSFHSGTYNWRGSGGQKTATIIAENASKNYYTYTLDWTPTQMDLYVDDHLFITYHNEGLGHGSWPFDETFYLILNIAIGGGWGGQEGIDDSIFPQTMEVDYVRVYELGVEFIDTQAPDPVTDLVGKMKDTSLFLTWKSGYDNYGIKSFEVHMDGELLSAGKVREVIVENFDVTQKHTFEVFALDLAGNKSEPTRIEYPE